MKSMRQLGAEREGTHGPRLVNADRVRGYRKLCALLMQGSSNAYCVRSRTKAKARVPHRSAERHTSLPKSPSQP